jgi:transcriptional regulator with XRE-family HTH domain
MYEEMFSARLAKLRTLKGVSARDMSLSIGQNPGYINNIETGKAFPSMTAFFFICEYLDITPQEFFDTETELPEEVRSITNNLKKLRPDQICNIAAIINDLATK